MVRKTKDDAEEFRRMEFQKQAGLNLRESRSRLGERTIKEKAVKPAYHYRSRARLVKLPPEELRILCLLSERET